MAADIYRIWIPLDILKDQILDIKNWINPCNLQVSVQFLGISATFSAKFGRVYKAFPDWATEYLFQAFRGGKVVSFSPRVVCSLSRKTIVRLQRVHFLVFWRLQIGTFFGSL